MKKLVLTIAIVLGLSLTTFAEYGGGLFQRGVLDEEYYGAGYYYYYNRDNTNSTLMPMFPEHNSTNDEPAPIGSGVLVLLGMGGAYLVAKKRKE